MNNEFEKQLSKTVYKYRSYFGDFYNLILKDYDSDINKILDQYIKYLNNKELILNNLIENLVFELHKISFKTLIYEFYLYKENNIENNNFYNYVEFIKTACFQEKIFNKYPGLKQQINRRIGFKIKLFEEILNRFSLDKQQIKYHIDEKIENIENISFSHGDSHNKGKSVAVIETNNSKIVYKPRNLFSDVLFNDLVNILNKHSKYNMNTVRTLSREEYGWQKFIERKNTKDSEEVCQYYYKIGFYLAIFYALRTDDLHYENIISNSGQPYIVDLETLTANLKIHHSYQKESIIQKFYSQLNNSVLSTMILPVNYKYSSIDYDVSALSTEEEYSYHWTSFYIENPGTDSIRISRKPSKIEKKGNLVILNNQTVKPVDYLNQIIQGFDQGFESILANKDLILDTLELNIVNKIKIRQLARPTNIYSKFTYAMSHPNYLSSKSRTNNLLAKLTKNPISADNLLARKEEVNALKEFDIPIYEQAAINHDLICNDNTVIKNYFQNTPKELIQERLSNMTEKDKKLQLNNIVFSLSSTNSSEKKHINHDFFNIFQSENTIEILKLFGQELISTSIHHEDKCSWIVQEADENEKVYISPLDSSLYNGAGILTYLIDLYKLTNEDVYLNLAEKGMEGLVASIDLNEVDNTSAFHGLGSLIYINARLYKVTKKKKYYEFIISNISKLVETYNQELEIDFINGLSGLIVMLCNCYKEFNDWRFLVKAEEIGKILVFKLEKNPINMNGLSHGHAGISLAFYKLFESTKKEQFVKLARVHIEEENKHYISEENNWKDLRYESANEPVYWCHGAPGIGLARYKIYELNKKSNNISTDFINAKNKIISSGLNNEIQNHSLCHGIFGNLDVLIEMNKTLKKDELSELINQTINEEVAYIREKGYISGIKSGFPLMNFMLGKPGIIYVLLRNIQPSTPCILTLDL